MCRWCVEYGNGNKWYLNPENYKEELYKAHGDVVQRFAGVAKNTVELGIGGPGMDDILEDRNDMSMFSMFAESHHAGQVMPIEDALEVLDLTGDRFLLMHCSCRRYMGHEDAIKCLWFEPGVDIALEERPWETESLVINREEAKEFLLQKDKEGSVQIIYDYGTFGDAKLPMSICNCVYPECASIRIRENLGGNTPRKSEYVAAIDKQKCTGCSGRPSCLPRCQWGALRYSPTERVTYVVNGKCFGCGKCRNVCPQNAIALKDRLEIPSLVDSW